MAVYFASHIPPRCATSCGHLTPSKKTCPIGTKDICHSKTLNDHIRWHSEEEREVKIPNMEDIIVDPDLNMACLKMRNKMPDDVRGTTDVMAFINNYGLEDGILI